MDPVFKLIHDTTGYEPSDATVNAAAGFGDGMTFGLTDKIRDRMGINGVVNKCSTAYSNGNTASILVGQVGAGRAVYVVGSKALTYSRNAKVLEAGSNVRNFMKRYMGPAVIPLKSFKGFRDRIKPWSEHVAKKGFDNARQGLGRTDPSFNKLIPLSVGQGGRFNETECE
ncbi:hypothetical protein [Acinetobacter wuhouensis]|uniref:hypothetical protein n=1 Tax=Acinetobacter wuhouensis TaxID=1879050 RepID=UPI00142D9F89|nr:hypothetical protein [Acinetobacter wuhouensis]